MYDPDSILAHPDDDGPSSYSVREFWLQRPSRAVAAPASAIETRFLLIPGDHASLRDFLRRAAADLANPQGTRATWPELAADVERAVALAQARLAEGDR